MEPPILTVFKTMFWFELRTSEIQNSKNNELLANKWFAILKHRMRQVQTDYLSITLQTTFIQNITFRRSLCLGFLIEVLCTASLSTENLDGVLNASVQPLEHSNPGAYTIAVVCFDSNRCSKQFGWIKNVQIWEHMRRTHKLWVTTSYDS